MIATLTDVIIAAPIGFAVGFVAGILIANRFIIVTPRDQYRVSRRDDRGDE
jgi:hypothetical protein